MFWEDRLNVLEEIGQVVIRRKLISGKRTWVARLEPNDSSWVVTRVGDKHANESTLSAVGETPMNACINLHSKLCGFAIHLTEEKVGGKGKRFIRWNGLWQILKKDRGVWVGTPRDEEEGDSYAVAL